MTHLSINLATEATEIPRFGSPSGSPHRLGLFCLDRFLAREGQMRICLRRRDFIAGLSGAAAWPLAARAQQGDRLRRIGVLMAFDENDPLAKSEVSAFTQALAGLGWTDGRNVRMNLRRYGDDINRIDTCILRWVTLANINVAKVPIFP